MAFHDDHDQLSVLGFETSLFFSSSVVQLIIHHHPLQ